MPTGWSTADDGESRKGLELAYELGARLFDTADVYGHGHSERLVGELVSHVDRAELVLTSKVGYFRGTAPHGFHPRHMRHQLEQSLENLRTDYLDIYSFHHPEFGEGDSYLLPAIEAMRSFREEGLVRAVGMRGPHRYAPSRLAPRAQRTDKAARFEYLFARIVPDILAVRDNLLTPASRSESIYALAERHGCGVLVNKPLGQGLLTAASQPGGRPSFGPGDHRARKRWFTAEARDLIAEGQRRLREIVGPEPEDLVRIALWHSLLRSDSAAVLAGFTKTEQVRMNLTCLGDPPSTEQLEAARLVMSDVQRSLDGAGEVFLDELMPRSVHS
jgi:methylglyoxal reductase